MAKVSGGELRRWITSRRKASARELLEIGREGPSSAKAIQGALALIALAGELRGWPLPEDPVSVREDRLAYERWDRLRSGWRR